jgi:uncharacterized protein (TIGR03067 family)
MAGLFLAGGLTALGGILFFTRSDKVRVTIELTDVDLADKTLSFFMDEEPISAEALARPIELKPGDHELVVKRGEKIVKRLLLTVAGGRSPGLKVKDITPSPTTPDERNRIVWKPLLRSAAELVEGETLSRLNPKGVSFRDGTLELNGHFAGFNPRFKGTNYIVRAKIVQMTGWGIHFAVRRQESKRIAYTASFKPAGAPAYAINKDPLGKPIEDLVTMNRRVTGKYPVAFAFSAYKDQLALYVDGKRVLGCADGDPGEGPCSFFTINDGHAFLRDLEVCVLDNTDLTPDDVFPQVRPHDDLARLQGDWDVWAEEFNGGPTTDAEVREMNKVLTFAGNRMTIQRTFRDGRRVKMEGAIRLDSDSNPRTWDFSGTHYLGKAVEFRGLYELDGDALRMVYDQRNQSDGEPSRPTAFRTQPKSSTVIMYARRRTR